MLLMMPGLQPDELLTIRSVTRDYSEQELAHFYTLYAGKRKEPQQLLIMTLIGFLGIAGIQRFVVGETGMGILYLLTAGLCGIGTIIDLININSIASTFNQRMAVESAQLVKMIGSGRA
ncbi:MAG: TM2 domain-containing protein [Chitinophagaceae bacterium]|nr:MAG: TM2 domain-containing protein [Chitinophagaceae bacterium]